MKSFSKFLYVAFAVMISCFFVHTTATFATTTTSSYVYDGLNQLQQVTDTNGTVITVTTYVYDAMGNRQSKTVSAPPVADTIAPMVTGFSVPAVVYTLQVPVSLFTATDNVAVVGYIITESSTAPLAGVAGWTSTAPLSYSVTTTGPHTLYAYAKDAAGNVSVGRSAPVAISIIQSYIGVFRNGTWYIDSNGNEQWDPGPDTIINYGMAGDIPVVGDWSGNGTRKIGLFRNGGWYLDYPGTSTWIGCGAPADPTKDVCITAFGLAGDFPVVGNWNNSADGKSKIGVFRNGTWYLDYPGTYPATGTWIGCGAPADPNKDACLTFGQAGDIPVVGDWNGDGKIKIGVFRSGTWLLDMNGDNVWGTGDIAISFGQAGDIPVVGDWNRDGVTKIGVFRPATGQWCLDMNDNDAWDPGADSLSFFGTPGDQPFVK